MFPCVAIGIATVVILLPVFFGGMPSTSAPKVEALSLESSGSIIVRTVTWSFLIAMVSTTMGWLLGIRMASLRKRALVCMQVMLVVTLVIPAYAIFYVWWQTWPSGTAFHAFVVELVASVLWSKAGVEVDEVCAISVSR